MSPRTLNRRQFLKYAAGVGGASLLAACGQQPPAGPAAAPTTAALAPTDAPKPTAAPTIKPTVKLRYHYLAWGPVADVALVAEEMSKITAPKIGATIELVPMDWNAFAQKLPLMFAAGEEMDLVFTSAWANIYAPNVSQGNLLDITDLLPQYAPKTWSNFKPEIWQGVAVKKRIYGAINEQIYCFVPGAQFRTDLAEKYGFDPTKKYDPSELNPYFEKMRNDDPTLYGMCVSDGGSLTWQPSAYGYDWIGGSGLNFRYDDPDCEPYFGWEMPEYVNAMKLAAEWVANGWAPKEGFISLDDSLARYKAGKVAVYGFNTAKPGWSEEIEAKVGHKWTQFWIGKEQPFVSTNSLTATLTGVARVCKNPEIALQLVELLNTDVELYNLLAKGIEGKHWQWVNKEKQVIGPIDGVTPDKATYNPNTDWMYGNQFNAYYLSERQADEKVWEQTRALNQSAVPATHLGFSFDPTPVQAEIGQMVNATAEVSGLVYGVAGDVDAAFNKMKSVSENSGAARIREEVKRQIAEWKAANA